MLPPSPDMLWLRVRQKGWQPPFTSLAITDGKYGTHYLEIAPHSARCAVVQGVKKDATGLDEDLVNWIEGGSMLFSLNRYERKKNIGLAIRALKEVIHRHAHSSGACAQCRLIVAGGYDPRVLENVQYFQELQELAQELDVEARVVFLRNITDGQRCATEATSQ